jgi:hypothetical protein
VSDSTFPLGEKANIEALYDGLYVRAVEFLEQKEMEISTAEFTFRIHLYSPNSPLINLRYFPLEASQAAQRHLTSCSSKSYYVFILSSLVPIRTAKVSEIWARRRHEVSPPLPLPLPDLC